MGMESQDPLPQPGSLSHRQVFSFLRMEPKTLGAGQIIIGVLIICLSVSVQMLQEVHITNDIWVFEVVAVQVILSGSVLVYSGFKPSLLWVKVTLVLHLISAAFSTAALGLMSKHLPYRQYSYHCEHCRRLEQNTVILIDGILSTLVIFLVLELVICIVAMLFGLSVLANGGARGAGGSQCPVSPQSQAPASPASPTIPMVQTLPPSPTVPAVETAPASPRVSIVHTAPAVETAPASPRVSIVHTTPAVQTAPASPRVSIVHSVPAVQTAPASPRPPIAHSVPAVHTVPVSPRVPIIHTLPVVQTVQTLPIVQTTSHKVAVFITEPEPERVETPSPPPSPPSPGTPLSPLSPPSPPSEPQVYNFE